MSTVSNSANLSVCIEHWLSWTEMLISRKVTEVSEISHVNLRAGWKELVQDVAPRPSSMYRPKSSGLGPSS